MKISFTSYREIYDGTRLIKKSNGRGLITEDRYYEEFKTTDGSFGVYVSRKYDKNTK